MQHFKRKLEESILTWMHGDSQRVLLIQGARRVGKTHLIRYLGEREYGQNFVSIDFQTDVEQIERIFSHPTDAVDDIIADISNYIRRPIQPETSLIFFDEVQLNERALNSLRFFAQSQWKVIASGSLLGVHTRTRTLPFPSGVELKELHPMDFEEHLWALGEETVADDIRNHAANLTPYILHEQVLDLWDRYLTLGGMPGVLAEFLAQDTPPEDNAWDAATRALEEIDATYIADMNDPTLGRSGVSAQRVWNSISAQLLRTSSKKFKYSEVIRGGRRQRLLEPLEWLDAAGIITIHDLTRDHTVPLTPFNEEEGSFFKVYMADTGLLFHKFSISPQLYLADRDHTLLSSDFRGALAENATMQALHASGLRTFYWMPDSDTQHGEVEFIYSDQSGNVVPVEVKSGNRTRAQSLNKLVKLSQTPVAYRLSRKQFSSSHMDGTECTLHSLPLYAAFTLKT